MVAQGEGYHQHDGDDCYRTDCGYYNRKTSGSSDSPVYEPPKCKECGALLTPGHLAVYKNLPRAREVCEACYIPRSAFLTDDEIWDSWINNPGFQGVLNTALAEGRTEEEVQKILDMSRAMVVENGRKSSDAATKKAFRMGVLEGVENGTT